MLLNGFIKEHESIEKLKAIVAKQEKIFQKKCPDLATKPPGGLIDEVEIFNRALSQSEIQTIVNVGSSGKSKR